MNRVRWRAFYQVCRYLQEPRSSDAKSAVMLEFAAPRIVSPLSKLDHAALKTISFIHSPDAFVAETQLQ